MYGIKFTPSVTQIQNEAQTSYTKEVAENSADTAKLIKGLADSLEKEKAERKASEKRANVLSFITLVIALLTLIATIAVPIALQSL